MKYSVKDIFSNYSEQYNEKFGAAEQYKKTLEKFAYYCDGNKSVLDLGCGPGNLSKFLKRYNPKLKITGLDFSKEMLEIARNELKEDDFICADLRSLPDLQKKYDIIICAFAIPYLTQNEVFDLIKRINDLIKENGVIYISFMQGDKSGYEEMGFSGRHKTKVERHDKKNIYHELTKYNFALLNEIIQDYTEPDGSVTQDIIVFFEKR
jgi:ubiquinone/menaquinone biosynthesis C-methylase UbiE